MDKTEEQRQKQRGSRIYLAISEQDVSNPGQAGCGDGTAKICSVYGLMRRWAVILYALRRGLNPGQLVAPGAGWA